MGDAVKPIVLTGALVLLLALPLRAASSRLSLPQPDGGTVQVEAWNASESPVGEDSRILGFHVTVRWSDRPGKGREPVKAVLRGDRAVLWVRRSQEAGRKGRFGNLAVYAEGGVVFERGPDRIEAERFLYDFGTGRGLVSRCRIGARLPVKTAPGRTEEHPFVIRAEELRLRFDPFDAQAPREVVCRDVSFTHCTFAEPHSDVHASKVKISAPRGRPVSEAWFEAEGVAPRFFGIPFFYLPWVGWKLDWRPLLRLHPGTSSEFGFFLDAAAGLRLRGGGRDGRPGREIGRLWLPVSYFEKRGTGLGLDGEYRTGEDDGWLRMEGEAEVFYLRDRGDRRPEAVARGLYPLERSDRWRARLWHRHRLPGGFRLDAEINAYSDRNYLLEFYEDEWKEEKPPESYVNLSWNEGNLALSALGLFRLNRFREEVEYLPRVRAWVYPVDLPADWLDVNLRAEVSRARWRPDEAAAVHVTRQAWRLDAEPEIAGSFLWGPIGLRPFLRPRWTVFETSALADGRGVTRTAVAWGLHALTWAWRVYDLALPCLGIRRLRHVMVPMVTYENVAYLDRDPSELVPFDDIETLQKGERLRLRLENRLEARFQRQGRSSYGTVARFDLSFDYFPRAERDNGGRDFSPLLLDVRLDPAPFLSAAWNATYDMDQGRMTAWNASLRLEAGPASLQLSSVNVAGAVHALTASVRLRMSARYTIKAYETHDFQRGELVEVGVSVRRTFHCWVLECGAVYDRGERNTTFVFSFLPTLFARDQTSAAVRTRLFE